MATSKYKEETALGSKQSFLICQLCSNKFRQPKLLSCLDTFCLQCIATKLLSQTTPTQTNVQCPVCSGVTELPIGRDSLDKLPSNHFVEKLIEMSTGIASGLVTKKALCSACERTTIKSSSSSSSSSPPSSVAAAAAAAVVYCVECDDQLCENCSVAHSGLKLTHSHQVLSMNAPDYESKLRSISLTRPPHCTQHANQLATLYCTDCTKPICMMCALLQHKPHTHSDLTQIVDSFRNKLQTSVGRLSTKHATQAHKELELRTRRDALECEVRIINKLIVGRLDTLKIGLDAGRRFLTDEMVRKNREMTNMVDNCLRDLQSKRIAAAAVCRFCVELLRYGSDAHVSETVCRLTEKTGNVVGRLTTTVTRPTPHKFGYRSGPITEMQVADMVGSVRSEREAKSNKSKLDLLTELSSPPSSSVQQNETSGTKSEVSVSTQLKYADDGVNVNAAVTVVGRIGGNEPVKGVGVIGDDLFVLHRETSIVYRYNRHNLVLKNTLTLTELENAADMAASEFARCLYISETSKNRIFLVNLKQTTQFGQKTVNIVGPAGVSVAWNGNVLVAQPKQLSFSEFSKELMLLRTIRTLGLATGHVLQIPYSTKIYIVRTSESVTLLEIHTSNLYETVTITDSKELASFKCLTHITFDSRNGILIVDSHSHRISVTNTTLSEVRPFIYFQSHSTSCVSKICLDRSGSTLYAGIGNCVKGDAVVAFKLPNTNMSMNSATGISTSSRKNTSQEAPSRTPESTSSVQTSLIGKVEIMEPVHGVAVVGPFIAVVYRNSALINIYSRKKLTLWKTRTVEGLVNATDMTATVPSPLGIHVFVTDSKRNKLFSIPVLATSRPVNMQNVENASGVSLTTSKCELLVAQRSLQSFTVLSGSDLQILRTILTPGLSPGHVVQLTSELFVVSESNVIYLVKSSEDTPQSMAEIVADSKSLGIFKSVTQLLVDRHQNILVVDAHSNQVVQVNNTLTERRLPFSFTPNVSGIYKACLVDDVLYIGTAGSNTPRDWVYAFQ